MLPDLCCIYPGQVLQTRSKCKKKKNPNTVNYTPKYKKNQHRPVSLAELVSQALVSSERSDSKTQGREVLRMTSEGDLWPPHTCKQQKKAYKQNKSHAEYIVSAQLCDTKSMMQTWVVFSYPTLQLLSHSTVSPFLGESNIFILQTQEWKNNKKK